MGSFQLDTFAGEYPDDQTSLAESTRFFGAGD